MTTIMLVVMKMCFFACSNFYQSPHSSSRDFDIEGPARSGICRWDYLEFRWNSLNCFEFRWIKNLSERASLRFCNTLISIPQVVDMTSGAGLIQLRIKNLFKVGSRQCFQRKSPLSSRKSFSHFYFTPNYPARPLLTPLNFSLHNLTSTQNLLIV